MGWEILATIAAGMVEIWVAVPMGLAFGLHPLSVAILVSVAGIAGAVIVTTLAEQLRTFMVGRPNSGILGRAYLRTCRLRSRYGVIGVGLFGSLLIGSPLSAAIGTLLGLSRKDLVLWVSIGIVTWSVLLTFGGTWGWNLILRWKLF